METAGPGDPPADAPHGDATPLEPPPIDRVPATSLGALSTGEGVDLALPRGCPFLIAEDGGWRLDTPAREHRCAAFAPHASLSLDKQARLCLTAAHTGCATFLASAAAREVRLGAPPAERATRWGLARTTTIIEDPGGLRARVLGAALDRRRWPAIPAVLLVTTLFTLAVSGFRAGAPTNAAATAGPSVPGSTPRASARSSAPAVATNAPAASDGPTTEPSTAPSTAPATPKPTARPSASFRTYRVVSGDTLSAIAAEFDTTVKALVALNNLPNASSLRVGQVLLIP